jgi:arginase family enzyme
MSGAPSSPPQPDEKTGLGRRGLAGSPSGRAAWVATRPGWARSKTARRRRVSPLGPGGSGSAAAAGTGIFTQVRRVSIVGVPSSAASYAAGQDLAPAALRSAGLLDYLGGSGLEVHDDGDLPHQVWSPDRDHPLAQNAGQATESLQQLAGRLEPLLARGDLALVLGGNCTIVLGVMAAMRGLGAGTPGLLYLDRHYDLNTPHSTTDGALDWMGLAHALALPGCVDTLVDAFGPRPLLEPGGMARGGARGDDRLGARAG